MIETTREADAHSRIDGGLDPDDFGRRLQESARDAHRILKRPHSHADDLIVLQRRLWFLLGEAPGPGSSAARRWLLATHRSIAARSPSWSAEVLESAVAA